MVANIVCGVDRSPEARAAARFAAALSERLDGRLTLLHAVTPSMYPEMPTYPYPASIGESPGRDAIHEAAQRLMSETLADIAPCDAVGRIEAGHAPERICRSAEELDAALIVVGTRGQGAASAALLGSVSLATIRSAARPVAVIPPGATTRARAPLDGDGIVCGVARPGDTEPARVATRLARALGMQLTLANVARRQDTRVAGSNVAAVPLAASDQQSERSFAAALGALDEAARLADGVDVRVLAGDPAERLHELAEREQAAMIVVGTRRHGPLRAGLFGSVSRSLACSGTKPVVICPEGSAEC